MAGPYARRLQRFSGDFAEAFCIGWSILFPDTHYVRACRANWRTLGGVPGHTPRKGSFEMYRHNLAHSIRIPLVLLRTIQNENCGRRPLSAIVYLAGGTLIRNRRPNK